GVAAARRVIVDADTIKAGVLAAGDERSKVWQRSADGNAKSDANPGHLASSDGMPAREGKPDVAVDRL
ncbi:hypothetical protein ACSTLC_23900, partial [Vibrio parahaemolyticus]